MKTISYYLGLSVILLCPLLTYGQFDLPGNGPTLSTQPRTPAPGETYTVNLNDFSTNTTGATIEWTRDGVTIPNTTNQRTITLTAGALGETERVTARMYPSDGGVLQAQTTIIPARVAVIVEADTSIPAWYQGRAVPSAGSQLRITAIPSDGSGFAPEQYTYSWYFNNEVVNAGATRGQFQNTVTMPVGRSANVRVTVTNNEGGLVAERSVAIPAQEPEVFFYETNALRGTSQLAINGIFPLIGSEASVRAEPYFMANHTNNFLEEWSINNRVVKNPNTDQRVITMQNGGGIGNFIVEYHIRNLAELLQGVEARFNVRF